jgi:hypothetical protein
LKRADKSGRERVPIRYAPHAQNQPAARTKHPYGLQRGFDRVRKELKALLAEHNIERVEPWKVFGVAATPTNTRARDRLQ